MNTKILMFLALTGSVFLASCSDAVDSTVKTGQDAVNTTTEVVSNTVDDATQYVDDMTTDTNDEDEGVMVGGAMMVPTKDIVDNAVESSDHTTLVTAVQAADLVNTLKSEGPFTVFAPTNSAFEALEEGLVDTLLRPENKDDLISVLTYHVVPGTYLAGDLSEGLELETVQGNTLLFTYNNDTWFVNGAAIEIANARSSNGVTHVIDTVLVPMTDNTMNDDDMSSNDMDDE